MVRAEIDAEVAAGATAVESLPAEGRGRPAQLVVLRFFSANKLNKNAKLLLQFDALALSEMLGTEVSRGKIVYGDCGIEDLGGSGKAVPVPAVSIYEQHPGMGQSFHQEANRREPLVPVRGRRAKHDRGI